MPHTSAKPAARQSCPICQSKNYQVVVTMGKEYLSSSAEGWRLDESLLQKIGLQFNEPDGGCAYYQCADCGAYFLRELYALEGAYAVDSSRLKKVQEIRERPRHPKEIERSMASTQTCITSVALAAKHAKSDSVKILDYGCGGGFHLKLMSSISPYQAYGYAPYDYDAQAIHRTHPSIEIITSPEDAQSKGPFDLIWCNQVLEHVYEPNEVLEHIHRLLRPGGILYMSAPSVTNSQMKKNIEKIQAGILVKAFHLGHVQIWNRNRFSLARHVASKGFSILPLPRYTSPPADAGVKDLMKYALKLNLALSRTIVDKAAIKIPRLGRFISPEFLAVRH